MVASSNPFCGGTYLKPRFRIRNLLNFILLQSQALTPILNLQNSSLFFQSKTVRERLILLQNFVDQRFLLRNMG